MKKFHNLLHLSVFIIFVNNSAFLQKVDYSVSSNWAIQPNQKDSPISEFISDSSWIGTADVFYVYPTLFLDKSDTAWNISIDNEIQRKNILEKAVKFQASAWAESGRMFVPFYRQAHIRSYSNLKNGGTEALLLAYSDIKNAFLYYLENYNNGRPIILAGHSQGSTHLSLLLKDFFDGTPLKKQLVAAYIPGIGIDKSNFKDLKLMEKADEINGFVTWNTFKKKVNKEKFDLWYRGKLVVNPVTWDLSARVSREFHKGFLFWNGKMYKKSFSTNLIDGAIWITTPHFPFRTMAFAMSDYHLGDVNLFWEDIRLNSKIRLQKWSNTLGKN